jgi:prevent-host-death family protein
MNVQKMRTQSKKVWQLQDAKAHFSELVNDAASGKPQVVTKRGKAVAVMLPISALEEEPFESALDALSGGPKLTEEEFDLFFPPRSRELVRPVDLE